MEDLEELRGMLRQIAQRAERVSLPSGWYSREGDCVFFFNEDTPYRGERVDELLTVYRALGSERIVGAQLKGIRSLPKHYGLILNIFQTGVVEMVVLFLLTYELQRRERPDQASSIKPRYNEAIESLRGKVPIRREDLVGV